MEQYLKLKPALLELIEHGKRVENIKIDLIGCTAIVGVPIFCKLLEYSAKHNEDFWNFFDSVGNLITK